MTEPTVLELQGKRYCLTSQETLPLQQDGFIGAAFERAGLSDPALKSLVGEALVREAKLRLMETGRLGQFLAGYLVPEGEPWTRDGAWALAHTIDAITNSVEKDQLYAVVGGLVLGFFSVASPSPMIGPNSSPIQSAAGVDSPSVAEAASIMGSGNP